MTEKRVVIVGAGIAGLTAALRLAVHGMKVTVVEKAGGPGGKMREVEVGGTRMDAGPTVFTLPYIFEEIFAEAGTTLADHVTLRRADVLARHAWTDGSRLDLFADIDRSADAIGRMAGAAEAKGFRSFCAEARRTWNTLETSYVRSPQPSIKGLVEGAGLRGLGNLWRIRPFDTLWGALGDYFHDPRLRQLFGRYATYCGASPFQAPATLMLVAHVEQEGVWLVEGGMARLAEALAGLARDSGVTFRYGVAVQSITTGHGRVDGVELADGERIAADAVLVNADTAALASGLFGARMTRATPPTPPSQRSLSAVTWNMVAEVEDFPLLRHTVFFSDDYKAEFDDIFGHRRLPGRPTVYVCAQDRDADTGTVPDGPERLMCLINAPAIGDTHTFTDKEIEQCATHTFGILARCGLRLKRSPDRTVVTTPTDWNRLFPATGGALYGPVGHGWKASFSRPTARSRIPGLYLAGGSTHPGPGVPMAALSGRMAAGLLLQEFAQRGVRFDEPVVRNGYAWWYIDALSDDGKQGLTVIAFIGSVFSPYYAWARRRGHADPQNHCALNVVLTGPGGNRWSMTERPRRSLKRDATHLEIGASSLRWDGTALEIDISETCMPVPSKIRGTVRVIPEAVTAGPFNLDMKGRHRWWPISPRCRVEVALSSPDLNWNGAGYFDTNDGDEALEDAFTTWDWCRGNTDRGASILYNVERRGGPPLALALEVDRSGAVERFDPLPVATLPATRWWRIGRQTRADAGHPVTVAETLVDAPFYARSVLNTRIAGQPVTAMHESLSLDRFSAGWVQALLPFRMPRVP